MSSASTIYPAEIAEHTVESLYAEHGPERPWTYWLALGGVIAALTALPLVKVDVSVHAPGIVRPATERTELKVTLTGRVVRLLVHDNNAVASKQPLLELDTADVDERLARNHALQAEHAALIADLAMTINAEGSITAKSPTEHTPHTLIEQSSLGVAASARLAGGSPVQSISTADGGSSPGVSVVLGRDQISAVDSFSLQTAEDRHLLATIHTGGIDNTQAYENTASPTTVLNFRTTALRAEYSQYQAQMAANHLATTKARNELTRYKTLAEKGIASRQELDNAKYEVERLLGEARLLVQQMLSRWQSRLREEQTGLDQLASEANRLSEEKAYSVIRAPVAGTVQGLQGILPGTMLIAGQTVGTVSPDDRLLIETYVSPKDVGLVRVGQATRLQIDAYPYTQWGLLDGTVESIAADSTASGQQLIFKVIVRPLANHLTLPNGVRGDLKKGLTLSARYLVARRSVLQLLYEGASNHLDPNVIAFE